METYKLRDLCLTEISDGTHQTPTYSETGYIFLSSKNVTTGKIDWDNVMYIPESLHNELYKRIRPQRDDILLAKNGTTGVAAIVDRDEVFDIYVSLALIRPDKSKVLPRYLLYAINSTPSKEFFNSNLKGIGVPNLHLKHIRETPIRVPSFDEQEHIIAVLDKVSNLLEHRKQQIEQLDELVKSRFIELFGDPNTNPKGWKKEQLQVNAKLLNGRAYKQDELLDDGKYPVLRVGNFFSNRGWYYSNLELEEDKYCDNGDLLYAWSASFGPKIWDGGKVIYHYHIWKVLVGEKYNKQFLCNLLDYATASFMGDTHGIGMMHLTKSGMEQTEFIVPPIEEQEVFAAFVEQTDKSKLAVQQSIAELEELKKSLMQQYFG